jgi:hypothetical protein
VHYFETLNKLVLILKVTLSQLIAYQNGIEIMRKYEINEILSEQAPVFPIFRQQIKTNNSVALVRERTIPTELKPLTFES